STIPVADDRSRMASTSSASQPLHSARTSRSAILRRYSAFKIRKLASSICSIGPPTRIPGAAEPAVVGRLRRSEGTAKRLAPEVLRRPQVGFVGEGQVARAGEDLHGDGHLDEVPLGDLVVVVHDPLVDLPEV